MSDDTDTKFCSNCKRHIAAGNFLMHEVHCRRNIVLCEQCEDPVPRSELEAHFDEYHAKAPCPVCQDDVEKCKLDAHQSLCPRRSVHCSYCELDMPHCDLSQHEAYCGTRTEPCPRCAQYIMLRDLAQHEASDCTYPPPKASPVQPNQDSLANNFVSFSQPRRNNSFPNADIDDFDRLHNSFAMNELSRILNGPTEMPSLLRNSHSPPGGAANGPASRYKLTRAPAGRTRNTVTNNKRTNEVSGRQTKPNNTSSNSPISFPATTSLGYNNNSPTRELSGAHDLDQLLAMHLAQDLSPSAYQDANLDGVNLLPDSLEMGTANPARNNLPTSRSPSPSAEDCLPCEFCGQLFPVDFFIQHQSICNRDTAYPRVDDYSPVDLSTNLSPPSEIFRDPPANSQQMNTSRNTQAQPQIVDNLSFLAAQDWISNATSLDSDCDVLLPCEFCDNPIPEDLLVQHQAVCEGTNASSPAASPDTPSRLNTFPKQVKSGTSSNLPAIDSSSRYLHRHQSDPAFDFLATRNLDNGPGAASGLVGDTGVRTKPRKVKDARNEAGKGTTQGARPEGLRRVNKKSFSNGSGQDTSPLGSGFDKNQWTRPRRQGSTAHAHHMLDHSLEDRSCPASDLMSFIGKEEKSNRNQRTKDISSVGAKTRGGPDPSPVGAVGGVKPRSRPSQRVENTKPVTYQNSLSSIHGSSVPRISSKPKPVVPRLAASPGVSNLQVRRSPKVNLANHDMEASGSSAPSHPPPRKRTSSRPRKAPQGEP